MNAPGTWILLYERPTMDRVLSAAMLRVMTSEEVLCFFGLAPN